MSTEQSHHYRRHQHQHQQDLTDKDDDHENETSLPSSSSASSSSTSSPSPSSSSPLILSKSNNSISFTPLSLFRSVAINLFLPFVNGLMLGFGELFAHEIAFRLGWSGTRVFPIFRRNAGLGVERGGGRNNSNNNSTAAQRKRGEREMRDITSLE